MTVTNVLAQVTTADFEAASRWCEALAGRPADEVSMAGTASWQLTPNGGIQLFADADHAGTGRVTIAVDDVDAHMAGIADRGLDRVVPQDTESGQFRVAVVADPDGNTLTFAQPLGG